MTSEYLIHLENGLDHQSVRRHHPGSGTDPALRNAHLTKGAGTASGRQAARTEGVVVKPEQLPFAARGGVLQVALLNDGDALGRPRVAVLQQLASTWPPLTRRSDQAVLVGGDDGLDPVAQVEFGEQA
ncbi:MAG: hypothetical protein JWN00_707 [Actinomycetia bacterium]|jgi:hypothetical protein|nr:hypothetical protein [Actinomycetes bacterium]